MASTQDYSDLAIPLTWIPGPPVWVEQWPMSAEKLRVLEALVAEQLEQGHIEVSHSAWNSPVFSILKKLGRHHLLHDLRRINERIVPMGNLSAGVPNANLIPQHFQLIIVDLKDCFFYYSSCALGL